MSLNPNHPYAPHRPLRPWPNTHPFASYPPNYDRLPRVFLPSLYQGQFYTSLGQRLALYNPTLYMEVRKALIEMDRGRESRYQNLLAG